MARSRKCSTSKFHPSFVGGEYLPDYKANEVQIARIELQSTTTDVISIRAGGDMPVQQHQRVMPSKGGVRVPDGFPSSPPQ